MKSGTASRTTLHPKLTPPSCRLKAPRTWNPTTVGCATASTTPEGSAPSPERWDGMGHPDQKTARTWEVTEVAGAPETPHLVARTTNVPRHNNLRPLVHKSYAHNQSNTIPSIKSPK